MAVCVCVCIMTIVIQNMYSYITIKSLLLFVLKPQRRHCITDTWCWSKRCHITSLRRSSSWWHLTSCRPWDMLFTGDGRQPWHLRRLLQRDRPQLISCRGVTGPPNLADCPLRKQRASHCEDLLLQFCTSRQAITVYLRCQHVTSSKF